jgi:prepilin-type N-terminal cleavage/methylation domain-containing protein
MMKDQRGQAGFTLIELLIAIGLLLIVSAIVTQALAQMTQSQQTIWNRTEMHSGIRGATELLQQEVGQAGRVALLGMPTLGRPGLATVGGAGIVASASCDPANPGTNATTVTVDNTAGMFANPGPPASYEMLTILDADNQESFRVASVVSTTQFQACFNKAHAVGTTIMALGGFATGIVPPAGVANGSSATVLKLYGDINGDGNMVYIEYTCDTVAHNLYRNVMAFNAGVKPALTNANILLSNIIGNPGGTACFTYQTTAIAAGTPITVFNFVLDVAVTLTVQTEQIDPITKQFQTETKALLNVSPRNVFDAWAFAGMGYTDRMQSTPTSITTLLP